MKKTVSICIVSILLALAFTAGGVYSSVSNIPDEIYLTKGEEQTVEFGLPVRTRVSGGAVNVVKLNGNTLADIDTADLTSPIVISPNEQGTADISFDILGIPIKNIKVTVAEERELIPGGQSIGVLLHTKGALVVGSMEVITSDGTHVDPAAAAGLCAGDIIEKVGDIAIDNAEHLSQVVNALGDKNISLTVLRGQRHFNVNINAVKDAEDGKYKLGVWVRDSTVGVGTMTYIDPETGEYAGLGHPITDIDTGNLLSVKDGEIVKSQIVEIVKGTEGAPGELKGVFDAEDGLLGSIEKNTEFGICGKLNADFDYYEDSISATSRDIREGDATLLCTLDKSGIREYGCRISRITGRSAKVQNFVVEITDARLINATGGIVQGMSGSPIIQDGKLIGAVTHVFVNDPTRGYGIFIENMLEAAG